MDNDATSNKDNDEGNTSDHERKDSTPVNLPDISPARSQRQAKRRCKNNNNPPHTPLIPKLLAPLAITTLISMTPLLYHQGRSHPTHHLHPPLPTLKCVILLFFEDDEMDGGGIQSSSGGPRDGEPQASSGTSSSQQGRTFCQWTGLENDLVPDAASEIFRMVRHLLFHEARATTRADSLNGLAADEDYPLWSLGLKRAPQFTPRSEAAMRTWACLLRKQGGERLNTLHFSMASALGGIVISLVSFSLPMGVS